MWWYLHSLGSARLEVKDPVTEGDVEPQISEFDDGSVSEVLLKVCTESLQFMWEAGRHYFIALYSLKVNHYINQGYAICSLTHCSIVLFHT